MAKAIGGLFGGSKPAPVQQQGPSPEVIAAQKRQKELIETQQRQLDEEEARLKKQKSSRDNLLAAIQGRTQRASMFGSAAGVQDDQKSKVLG